MFDVDFANSDIEFIGVFNQIDLEVVTELDPDLILWRENKALATGCACLTSCLDHTGYI